MTTGMTPTIFRRSAAAALWSAALVLMLLAAIESETPLDLYAWACFLSLLGSTFTMYLIVDHIARSARVAVADAVGVVIGEELDTLDGVGQLHPIR